MNFKILRFNEKERTMVIDWGWIRLNHYIPEEIINNSNLTENEVIEIIEKLRPEEPEPIEIPTVLKTLYEKSNQPEDPYSDTDNGEDVI
jgi:hypothetical protein